MKIQLKQDWIIPAGTVFTCADGLTRIFMNGNYETLEAISPNSTATIYIDRAAVEDRPDLFEIVP